MIISRLNKTMLAAVIAMCSILSSQALPLSYYAQNSKLSTGKWVKIKVSKTGVHEISYDDLRSWGFSDPSKVLVYGYPATTLTDNKLISDKPDDLCQQYTYHFSRGNDSKICFYAVADIDARVATNSTLSVKRNIYSLDGYYFLTDSQEPETFSVNNYVATESRTRVTTHLHLEYVENDRINPVTGGAVFFDESLIGRSQTVSFPVPFFNSTTYEYSTYLIYQFASDCLSSLTLAVTPQTDLFTIRANSQRPQSAPGYDSYCRFFYSNYRPLDVRYNSSSTAKNWDITFSLPATAGSMTFAALDYAALVYPSYNSMTGMSQTTMFFPDAKTISNMVIDGTNSHTQLWNVNNPAKISTYSKNFFSSTGETEISFERNYTTATGPCAIVAFNPAGKLYNVEYEGEVKNQNIHGQETPHMVIITPAELKPQADRLAQVHKDNQDLDVLVVTDREVYNEFSSGTPSAMAYRRVAKMFYDRDSEKFRHLLLFGAGSWDNRNIIIPAGNKLLTYEAEQEEWARHPNRSYCTDSYFGMMSEKTIVSNLRIDLGKTNNPTYTADDIIYTKMDINVGRLPIDNISDARATVDKIENYLVNPPIDGSYNSAVLVCDDGDDNQFLLLSDTVAAIANEASTAFTVNKLFNALYPFDELGRATVLRNSFKMALAKGQGLWGYVGHGRSDMMGSGEVLYTISDIDNFDYNVPPIAMLATCDNLSFDRTTDDIGAHLLRKVNGGAIGVVAACRSVYKQYNENVDRSVSKAYFTAKAGSTTGDIFRNGRNEVIAKAQADGDKYMAVNTLCYNFGGDPAIPVYVPSLNVATTAINGVVVDGSSVTEVYPLTNFDITGDIVDEAGNVAADFNGSITIEIYDGTRDVQSSLKGESKPEHTKLVHLDETLLATATGTVTNGHFTVSVFSAVPIYPETNNRISYYAARDDKKVFASGSYDMLNVLQYNAEAIEIVDNDAPVITAFYLNSPDFTSGDEVSPSPMVYVEIERDATGFNVSDGRIGNGAKLVLDGKTNYPYIASAISYNGDGSASVKFGLSNIADGYHTLEFSISDNMGNRSSRSLGFVVVNRMVQSTLLLAETPARTEANFRLDHNFKAEPTGRLIVEDFAGNVVFSQTGVTFPYAWDLRDNDGNVVADGHYNAFAILNAGNEYGNTAKIPVVVIK